MTESLPRYEIGRTVGVLGVRNKIESDFASENECLLFTVTLKEARQSYASTQVGDGWGGGLGGLNRFHTRATLAPILDACFS